MRPTFTLARMAAVIVSSAVIAAGCGGSEVRAMRSWTLRRWKPTRSSGPSRRSGRRTLTPLRW